MSGVITLNDFSQALFKFKIVFKKKKYKTDSEPVSLEKLAKSKWTCCRMVSYYLKNKDNIILGSKGRVKIKRH